jgi:hypothetical protein
MSITNNVPYGFELEAMPLGAFGGVGGHKLKPIPGSLQLYGGGFKKAIVPVLAITAAVVAPYAIPAMATAIGASASIGVAASYAAAGAIYGATAGALTSAVGGGNIGRGALIGGAVGGVGGYIGAPATGATGATATGATAAQAPLGTVASAAPTTATGLGGTGIASTTDLARQVATGAPTVGLSTTGAPSALGTQLSGTAAGAGIGGTSIPSVSVAAPAGLAVGTTPTGLGPTLAASQTGQLATAPVAGAQAAGAAPQDTGFVAGVKNVGSAIANRFTDPQMLADITLRAAGQLAGSAIAGDGLSAEQQELVNLQMAELQNLQQTNQAAFNQRLEAAQALLGEARYFDPEYFGLQRARQQQTAGAVAKREGTRGTTGEQRRAEERRYDIATGRNVGTAFDQGYLTGVQGRLQAQQAGLAQLPMPSAYTTDYSGMASTLRANEEQRLAAAQQVGNLFGDLTGYSSSRSQG